MGDDWVDCRSSCRCGLAVSVPEAPAAVRQSAFITLRVRPAGGARSRETCELIMQAQGTLDAQLARFYLMHVVSRHP